ncbi:2-Amino-2-deoxy-isochorismate synthase [Carbonactinospora thermoautotrophica]|uniref:anthranilate synthase n=1 Tax=Carbonactinospora thermoautotrophica TaxID=1469144 RepID=A0A132MUT9_9ACTN|nr:anthranilate synthase family protein [Carbonactinospora thermoautotrophica]KWX01470.1 2-Amino-2-deoxy-isochorismate synthase [Carbonactinospora thermoautotrophica]
MIRKDAEATDGSGVDLTQLLAPDVPAFALLWRPESVRDEVEVLIGDVSTVDMLADLPLPDSPRTPGTPHHELLVVVPYRQIAERGFAYREDGEPLLAMTVRAQGRMSVSEALRLLPDDPVELADADFDIDDESYSDIVRKVLAEEIGRGEGSNFVIRRSFVARVKNHSARTALAVFRRLLARELGAYWTFLVHTDDRTFIGATPERHVSLADGVVVMNPISGTYRYPPSGLSLPDVLRFLADRKEAEELYMVVDEELKMMTRVCDLGVRVIGPRLKEMAKLAHTEYFIEGRSSLDVRDVLRETMFAPTVTGSPLENAFRVIARYEPRGRGYYSGVLALIGRDARGARTLDSAILIRTAEIDRTGRLRIGVGATLVRHSDPASEVAETRAKATALLAALEGTDTSDETSTASRQRLGEHPEVRRALQARNDALARFWLEQRARRDLTVQELIGCRVLLVDAEDTFTAMLAHQLRSLGLTVVVRRFDEPPDLEGFALIVVGPGPGDPRAVSDPKIATLRGITRRLLAGQTPFLAVCLGHQVLSSLLGLKLIRKQVPNQGLQKEIDFFGRRRRVAFYNTFTAVCSVDRFECAMGPVEVSRDAGSGEVHALRGPGFRSVQFHPESVLTEHGVDILRELVTSLLLPVGLAT